MKQLNNFQMNALRILTIVLAALLITACQKKEDNPSLYSEEYFHTGAAPVIDTIIGLNGDASKLASIAKLKIVGKNFSTNSAYNLVDFNNVRGTVTLSTATEIYVTAPNYANDSLMIRVAVTGPNAAASPSNKKPYPLQVPLTDDRVLKAGEQFPKAITIDASGTIYANLATSTDALNGIVTIDTAGNLLTILPSTAQQFMWKDMKIGPGGDLFLVGPQRVLKQLPKGGAALVNYAPIPAADGVVSLNGLDFDASQNAWVGGEVTANKFYSITIPGKVVTSFTFDGIIKALRVYNGYLYIGAKAAGDADYKIFRFQINSSTSIGAKELYYDFGQKYPGKEINSMTFSSDGYLYVGILGASNGTNDMPGIVLISPAGAGSEDFYSGALVPASSINNSAAYSSLAWGIGKYLYAIRTRQYLVAGVATVDAKIVKINALKLGAPYYGR